MRGGRRRISGAGRFAGVLVMVRCGRSLGSYLLGRVRKRGVPRGVGWHKYFYRKWLFYLG